MEFPCGCWRKPLTRSHRPWPCYSTNPCGLAFFRETGNSRILYPFSRKERETLWRITALFPLARENWPLHWRQERIPHSGNFRDWFRSYLQERKQQVTALGATSRELPVTSGVPQGSLLGPILFLLFVDDLPNTVKASRVACYTDDTEIFKSIDSITDCNALQSDLNDLVCWSELSGLILNQSKCKIPVYHPQKITCTAYL